MSKIKSYISNYCLPQIYKPKSLEVVLLEAHLISATQIEIALKYQTNYPCLSLEEIICLQGWINTNTSDFFAKDWSGLIKLKDRKPLGYYLQRAGLLEEKDIRIILEEQKVTNLRFGALAVLRGHIKPETLDFFLFYLFPDELGESYLRTSKSSKKGRQRKRQLINSIVNKTKSSLL